MFISCDKGKLGESQGRKAIWALTGNADGRQAAEQFLLLLLRATFLYQKFIKT